MVEDVAIKPPGARVAPQTSRNFGRLLAPTWRRAGPALCRASQGSVRFSCPAASPSFRAWRRQGRQALAAWRRAFKSLFDRLDAFKRPAGSAAFDFDGCRGGPPAAGDPFKPDARLRRECRAHAAFPARDMPAFSRLHGGTSGMLGPCCDGVACRRFALGSRGISRYPALLYSCSGRHAAAAVFQRPVVRARHGRGNCHVAKPASRPQSHLLGRRSSPVPRLCIPRVRLDAL